jgi:OOP family OmpA-OmpF porin
MKRNLLIIFFIFSISLVSGQDSGDEVELDSRINVEVEPEPLNEKINSKYLEGKPLISSDGLRLFFSRSYHPENFGGIADPEDIWFSELKDGKWGAAVNIGAPLNNDGPNFVSEVIGLGDTLVVGNVYQKKGMRAGVSVAIKVEGEWSQPEKVYIDNDYNWSERASYDVSPDRDVVIIAEQKDDSKGKTDLYVSFRIYESKHTYALSESVNMGPVINSTGDDITPKLSNDGKGIYFSSNGHKGYGGFDLFYSERLDDSWTNWSPPKNLGPGLNTPFDDQAPSLTPDEKWAYYSRGISATNQDIYKVNLERLYSK